MIKSIFYMICENIKFWNHNKICSMHICPETKIGHHSTIGKGTYIYKNVRIGDYSYINKNSNIENCTIGNYCSISSNVFISPQEHNLKCFSTYPQFDHNKNEKQTVIGNDVLISAGAFIKQGVTIGNGAVVGMGAVVTKDVPEYAVVVGNPAKVLRFRFSKKVIESIKNSHWWSQRIESVNQSALNELINRYGENAIKD